MVIFHLYRRFKTFNSFLSHSHLTKRKIKEKMKVFGLYEKLYEITTAINKAFGFQTMIITFSYMVT